MDHAEVQILEHRAHGHAGVVDQDVDAPEALHRRLHQGAAVRLLRDVAAHAEHALGRSHGRRQFEQRVVGARGHHDLRPLAAELTGGSQSDAGTGSRHDNHLVL